MLSSSLSPALCSLHTASASGVKRVPKPWTGREHKGTPGACRVLCSWRFAAVLHPCPYFSLLFLLQYLRSSPTHCVPSGRSAAPRSSATFSLFRIAILAVLLRRKSIHLRATETSLHRRSCVQPAEILHEIIHPSIHPFRKPIRSYSTRAQETQCRSRSLIYRLCLIGSHYFIASAPRASSSLPALSLSAISLLCSPPPANLFRRPLQCPPTTRQDNLRRPRTTYTSHD